MSKFKPGTVQACRTRELSADQKLLLPVSSADSSPCAGGILLCFVPRATFSLISNMFDTGERLHEA